MKKSILKQILTNHWILYIVMVLAMYNIIYCMCRNDTIHLLVFIASILVTKYFTHNMILILGIPLLLSLFSRMIPSTESFTDASKEETKSKPELPDISDPTKSEVILPIEDTVSTDTPTPKDPIDSENYSNRINYASTLSNNIQSYRDILGKDAFVKMTEDTKELLRQQDELGQSIKQFTPIIEKMTPFISQATVMLNKLDTAKINDITKTIKNM